MMEIDMEMAMQTDTETLTVSDTERTRTSTPILIQCKVERRDFSDSTKWGKGEKKKQFRRENVKPASRDKHNSKKQK